MVAVRYVNRVDPDKRNIFASFFLPIQLDLLRKNETSEVVYRRFYQKCNDTVAELVQMNSGSHIAVKLAVKLAAECRKRLQAIIFPYIWVTCMRIGR